jgi:hypothetical protein
MDYSSLALDFNSWLGQFNFKLIDEAPAPIFPRLERGNDRVASGARVLARVSIF